jgi:transglutaminase-like putative cysteine protease
MTRTRHLLLPLCLFAFVVTAQAQQKQPKIVEDVWEVAFYTDADGKDQKFGYSRFQVVELEQNGAKHLRARRELRLTVRRGPDEALIRGDMGNDETLDGKVIGIYAKTWTGQEEAITIEGQLRERVKSKENEKGPPYEMALKVTAQKSYEQPLPWSTANVGLIKELSLLRERKVKTGDEFEYRQFVPTLTNVFRVKVKVGQVEEVKLKTETRKLLRVEAKPDAVKLPDGQEVQLPESIQWVDPTTYVPVLTETELPGVGTFKLLRTSKEEALAPNGVLPNLFTSQSIKLDRPVADINETTAITYRITLTGKNAKPEGLLKQDARQVVEKIDRQVITLHVESIDRPQKINQPKKVGDEFLQSNNFITSDSEDVKKLAAKAVGTEKDPWAKAQKIERWVRDNMRPINFTQALTTAATVAKTLNGDCTEYAMLAAAMCRAEGIPSRTALGLVYVDGPKPVLGFHMWTEVFVEGQWMGIDATIGRGHVGPGHLKITDHSWAGVRGFDPLLPVTGFMLANPKIEIIQVRRK